MTNEVHYPRLARRAAQYMAWRQNLYTEHVESAIAATNENRKSHHLELANGHMVQLQACWGLLREMGIDLEVDAMIESRGVS